jgi:hypothetical protein
MKALGVRRCAALAGIDAGHLTRIISGERKLIKAVFEKFEAGIGDRRAEAFRGRRP